LAQYFITTLVPLGADLWAYSWTDIKQTVGSAGGIKAGMIIGFLVLISLALSALIYFPRKLQVNGGLAAVLLLCLVTAGIRDVLTVTNSMMPGQEYSNNLSLNKSYFFFKSSYQYFYPATQEKDIYSDSYSGDYTSIDSDSSLSKIKYVDEKNYPFLHSTDSTADVLSPFFTPSVTPPNIVILSVEGLGRAFTNKGAYLGNFTPFIDSLAEKSLYWENFLSEGGRTFAVLPSLLSSLPFAKNGFAELGASMPKHLSLLNILKNNGYNTSFYYGGDSHFDNMDAFLQKNSITTINDEKTFPAGYTKMPEQNGFTWGYGDKELFRRFFETNVAPQQPYISVVMTASTHNPFLINEQDYYLQRVEQRMTELGFDDIKKQDYRRYKKQYASILFMNDAVKGFINKYKQRPDFNNTVFLITGDHRMPEIPMSTKIDRYHVPLLIYSPLLNRRAKFSSISTHFDITPTLLAWLKKSHHLQTPSIVNWMGSGLDTARQFRNRHAYPLMQTKNDIIDFVMGEYMLNGNDLYHISNTMDLNLEQNETKANELKAAFNRFKTKNNSFIKTLTLVPDSLLQKYTPQ